MAIEYYGAIYPQDGVSEYLKVTLTNSSYSVTGYISQGAAMNIAQSWEAPFTGMSMGSVAGALSGFIQAGTESTSVARWNTLMVWEGGTPPTVTLPITFLAQYNPFIEVSGAIAALSAMISPELKDANIGGRIPERVILNIGRRINITDVIIQDLSFDLDAPRNSSGLFLRNTVNLQLSGSRVYNGSEILGAFQ
ncbi:hypothetical protein ABPE25_003412 [Salmonella enterica subsp. enterica serovar Newport]|uniref:Morphogenetic protein n=1 Tax=Salmonella enterica subsp. enterica serovar Berkeley TaxID=1965103 RepID=A0A636K0V2_SALET|nr:hypothetical protein [Salmonella enterica]EBG3585925.1 hypothetical protein [Salmonella enterica subsp. enterica]EBQ6006568.1 hypothetical protein [Salmonella enterica subsp. enterica serovar Berkeley]EBS0125365.1 hypothetical protein [Salmonella enterica subsp. enterica serovar Javiana]EBU8905594.1 hypothetical protein [Salmonella enterica subsp. enterica serovar Vuadens]EBV6641111.1 hypothetical protein [Salmonella enterica subsp. enterica serovar Pomona]EBW4414399.1 hypothetical protein